MNSNKSLKGENLMGNMKSEANSDTYKGLSSGLILNLEHLKKDSWTARSRLYQTPKRHISTSRLRTPECPASLAYSLRGFEMNKPDRINARKWDTGFSLEAAVIEDLRKEYNWTIIENGVDGEKLEYSAFGGHVKGHPNGLARTPDSEEDEWFILIVKSINDSSWETFKNAGSKWKDAAMNPLMYVKPFAKYYYQCQSLMGMSGINKCLLLAVNRNSSKYELKIVDFEEEIWNKLKSKFLLAFKQIVGRINDKLDGKCINCSFKIHCHRSSSERVIPSICAGCVYSEARENGNWYCNEHSAEVTADHSCSMHQEWHPYFLTSRLPQPF